MSQAELSVKSDLNKIIEQLSKIRDTADQVSSSMSEMGENTNKRVNEESKKVETTFQKMRNIAGRTADQLRRDFKSLLSINQLEGAISLSNQFQGSIKETISLSDAIRKLGGSFGIASKDFSGFQTQLTKGLGDIGMSSEEAADTLKGLAGSGVTGSSNITEYAKAAAQLASLGGEKGKAGDISGSLAGVVRAQGKSVNDPAAMQAIAHAVTKSMEGTGKSASEVLKSMEQVFQAMPAEMRKSVTPAALTSYAAAETVGGPGATGAMKDYLSSGQYDPKRMALDAQGFGKVFTKDGGLNIKELKKFSENMKARGLDARGSLKTAGFSDEQADGLVRLSEGADRVAEAMERTANASDDYATKTRKNMGLQEAFQANVNKIKSIMAPVLSRGTQGMSDLLSSASGSTMGAATVVGGAGILGALMAGGGLRGIGEAMGGGGALMGQAKKQIYEEVTGKKVQDVYVVNAGEIAAGGVAAGGAGMMSKAGGLMGKAGAVGGAGMAGYAIGEAINPLIDKYTQGKTSEGFEGNAVEQLFFKLDKLVGGQASKNIQKAQEVHVKLSPELKKTKNARGASYGP